MIEVIGWIGAWCLALCGVPAAWKSYKDGHSEGLSTAFVALWLAGEILTLAYVMPKQDLPLITNYCFNIVLISVMVYYKIWPRKRVLVSKWTKEDQKMLDELELADRSKKG